jgi:hypothetical protein
MITAAGAQETVDPAENVAANYCSGVAANIAHGDALKNFCLWVLAFDKKLPDIIGNQETRRYHTENGKTRRLLDTTDARIAYIQGRSHFTEISINHVKVAQAADNEDAPQLQGAWSYGDYGSDLRLLFRAHANSVFSFASQTVWQGLPVLVFNYSVPENHWWEMRAREAIGAPLQTTFPAYAGRILLDSRSFALVRFERQTTAIEKHFPLRFGSNEVNYNLLPLGDGSSFVLPVEGVVTFCHDDKHHNCEINDTTFTNWQKFGAKSRILTDTEPQ